ncbi:hypothetical protein GGF40_002067 [Coemansia sp. RSA 1286]|nr:hypothetical protein IWW45_003818 [Coemansia sp. RSA 485]KAJ2637876.1 hypothetical protein GGF40_002067 [Coemansia sp. RSA 1286]KAJ2705712.1 hypothetical protein FB645_002202 [Coemansia sp. IMI 203386]
MSSVLISSFNEAHSRLFARASPTTQVYVSFVFKAYTLRTKGDFALCYFFLIVLGVVERLFSLAIDVIADKPGQPWRIFPRACLYYVVTLIRYVLMIAIMNSYVPMLLVTCLGLALGQIAVECIRYYLMLRRIKRKRAAADGFNSPKDSGSLADSDSLPPKTTHVNESCC